MSETPGEPRILLRRPKKSQRVPVVGLSQPSNSAAASFLKSSGDGARNVSTASGSSAAPRQPLWQRFRTVLTTALVLNGVLLGYVLFRTYYKPTEILEEDFKKISEDKEKESSAQEATPSVVAGTTQLIVSENASSFEPNKPKIAAEDQLQLYKWILEERRKVKPSTKEEKAKIDAEKELLKSFLKSKTTLNV